jgi:hypothetical protein
MALEALAASLFVVRARASRRGIFDAAFTFVRFAPACGKQARPGYPLDSAKTPLRQLQDQA